jgi:hypothetical protein
VRVLLLTAPSPEPLNGPLLGLQCVAAALLGRGHEVAVLDPAAAHFDRDADWIESEVERLAPDVVGMGLFTRWAWHGYRLAERLAKRGWLLVEVSPDRAKDVKRVLTGAGYRDVESTKGGELKVTRVIVGRRPS